MTIKKIISIVFLGGLFTVNIDAMSLDRQIAKMKNAPPEIRVKMMNSLKKNLVKMNSSQRARIIQELRKQVSPNSITPRVNSRGMLNYAITAQAQQSVVQHLDDVKNITTITNNKKINTNMHNIKDNTNEAIK